MHTKESLIKDLEKLKINNKGTLLVHSSMKSIGEVQGGAEVVLDALCEYMKDGLLVLPTHTWSYINEKNPRFHVKESKTCVGILTELFRNRPGVIRSLHPTHSVAALGRDALEFTSGDEGFDTPCARGSAWGKLLDRKASIMFIGVDLKRNTFMHGVEEWAGIPGRISDAHEDLYTILEDGREIYVPSRRHCGKSWSEHYWKVEELFLNNKVMYKGSFGDAEVRICDAEGITELLLRMMEANPELFSDNNPLEEEFYKLFAE